MDSPKCGECGSTDVEVMYGAGRTFTLCHACNVADDEPSKCCECGKLAPAPCTFEACRRPLCDDCFVDHWDRLHADELAEI